MIRFSAFFLSIFFLSCSSDLIEINITDSSGNNLNNFSAIISDKNGTSELLCENSNGKSAVAKCSTNGLKLIDTELPTRIFIKCSGYEFTSGEFEKNRKIKLEKLTDYEKNEDYTTGFTNNDGIGSFTEYSHDADTELGRTSALKFIVTNLKENPKVYFMNTKKHPLHYDFARQILKIDQTITEFQENTYEGKDRTAMAGTILYYPDIESAGEKNFSSPLVITFFPSDNLTPDQALLCHKLIEERLNFIELSGPKTRVAYLPAGEDQEKDLSENRQIFLENNTAILFRRELYCGIPFQLLNMGTAYGTLLLKTPEDLEKDVVSFKDILVLTRLPNELPVVGGTITAEIQTPLAHVNVAARNRGTPNMALPDAENNETIKSLLNKIVKFEVKEGSWNLTESTLEEAQIYWESIKKEASFPQFDLENKELFDFDEIEFNDSISYGAKTANVAELSKLLRENAPTGFAVPFYYYDQFLKDNILTDNVITETKSDCVKEGRESALCQDVNSFIKNSLGQTIDSFIDTMLNDEHFSIDSPFREAALDALRYIIGHSTVNADLTIELNAKIKEIHGDNPVRLRSSTNAEDLENFSGAGLYRSVTAYASGDDRASSLIRKVWASVWNYSAFEERSLWSIDHKSVKMGILVHQSFPDENANGVLITQNISDSTIYGHYVNVQIGEVSVTNPENGALPEIFVIVPGKESGVQVSQISWSSLSPETPILSPDEITELFKLSNQVHGHFSELYEQNEWSSIFDIEFKFIPPDRKLMIKQVRPYINR